MTKAVTIRIDPNDMINIRNYLLGGIPADVARIARDLRLTQDYVETILDALEQLGDASCVCGKWCVV